LVDYIKNQRAHHAKFSFEDEYRSLLRLHDIDFDDRYLLVDRDSIVADATGIAGWTRSVG